MGVTCMCVIVMCVMVVWGGGACECKFMVWC